LNVAAVGPDELVRLWPVFDLTAASHSKGDSFWIVTVITDDIGDGSASTFVVDAAGSLFQVTGNTFAVLATPDHRTRAEQQPHRATDSHNRS